MLLSIIIPCYNSAKFISSTLDMLIAQGLDDCEIIVVNDGSTDATSEIVHSYSQKNERIKIIDKINEGVSVARNTGMEHSTGKYIIFLDSDDTLEVGTLDFYRRILKLNPNREFFAFGYYTKYKNKVKKNYAIKKYDGKILDSNLLKQSFFLKKLCFHICSCIYESSFLIKNSIQFTPGVRIGEDVEFLLKVLAVADTCVYHARHCFVYQIRDDSVMQGYKTFSETHFNSYVIRRNICLSEKYQIESLKLYSNFWLQNQYVSHLILYLISDFKSYDINDKFIQDSIYLSLPVVHGVWKNTMAIAIVKLFPVRLILRIWGK